MSAHVSHEARLRAALHAAADSLEPRADGLERIRTRLRQPRPAYVTWAETVSAEIVMRTPAWLQDAVYRVADSLRLAYERFAPTQAPGRHRSRAQGLLRPLAAMAVVMFIVAAGTYVAIDASTAIFPSSSSSLPGGAPNSGGHSGVPASHAPRTSGTQSAAGTGTRSAASPTCKPASPKPGTTSAPPPPPPSPSASPSPSDSSTSTDTSSPSPTDTSATTTPAASPAPSVAPPPPATTSPSPGPVLTPAC